MSGRARGRNEEGYADRAQRHGSSSAKQGFNAPPYPTNRGGDQGGYQGKGSQGGASRGQQGERDRYEAQGSRGPPRQPPPGFAPQQSRDYGGDGQNRGYRQEGQDKGYRQECQDRGYRQEAQDRGYMQEGQGRGYWQDSQHRAEGRYQESRQHQDHGGRQEGASYRKDEGAKGGQGRYQDSRGPPESGRHQGPRGYGQGNEGGRTYQDNRQQHQQGHSKPQQQAGDYSQRYEQPQRPHVDRGSGEGSGVIDMMSTLSIRKNLGNQVFLHGKRGLLAEVPEEKSFRDSRIVTKGTIGDKVRLSTNLFRFELGLNKAFHHYAVSFSPSIESTRLKRRLLGEVEKGLDIKDQYVTDGSSLFTTVAINEAQNVEVTFRDMLYKVEIKRVATIQTNSRHVIQVLNVIFGNIVQNNLGYRWDSGNYYNYAAKINIDGTSLSAYPGFFTSILNYDNGTRLMLDVSHKIITSQNAWEACGYDYRKARAKLIGKIVYTCYNGKTYKVDDVETNKSVSFVFKYRGRDISIRDYFKEKYGITPGDASQPLLVVKPNRREQRAGAPEVIYLVPEFCLITGIDERDRSNRMLMTKLDAVTKPSADIRAHKMLDFASLLGSGGSAAGVLKSFGISYSDKMELVEGRVLPMINATQSLGSVTRGPLLSAKSINKWMIVYGNEMGTREMGTFLNGLTGCMKQMGMHCKEPLMRPYRSMSEMQSILASCPADTDMVLVIIKGNNKVDYSTAKLTLCVNNPIPSQVVTSFVAQKGKPVICSKIALQINCKMGGAGWSIKNMNTKDTMVVGVDTYHDSENRNASFMGVVATMNDLCSKYFTTWSKQDAGREVAVNFRALMTECMAAYRKENGRPCRRVVVYRDGVGDGQLEYLLGSEVKDVERALVDLGWKGTGIAYIVVKKRVHARFFKEISKDHYDNAPKGTVIDSVATRPCWMDFYLINQKANQGTLTPTHFNVLLNSTDMSIDAIQLLSYQQCFMYYNWTDSIRVPAPCQYAHKVAFLIGQALHRYPDGRLNNKLFYL